MKMLIDFLAGLVALLAAAALSHLGIDLQRPTAPIEVKRLPDHEPANAPASAPDENRSR